MHYLLDETEMAAFRQITQDQQKMPTLQALTMACQHIATQAVGQIRPGSDYVLTTPHGCIHVEDPRGRKWRTRYCDFCPVRGICPQPKAYSK